MYLARKAKTQRTEDKTSLKQLEKAQLSLKKIKIMQEKRRPIVKKTKQQGYA